MIDTIKTLIDTIEEMQDFEALIDDYTNTRLRLQEDIKKRLEAAAGADNVLMNDINDYGCICKEEGVCMGLYYGIKLLKIIKDI